jgi:hypothetical protein
MHRSSLRHDDWKAHLPTSLKQWRRTQKGLGVMVSIANGQLLFKHITAELAEFASLWFRLALLWAKAPISSDFEFSWDWHAPAHSRACRQCVCIAHFIASRPQCAAMHVLLGGKPGHLSFKQACIARKCVASFVFASGAAHLSMQSNSSRQGRLNAHSNTSKKQCSTTQNGLADIVFAFMGHLLLMHVIASPASSDAFSSSLTACSETTSLRLTNTVPSTS